MPDKTNWRVLREKVLESLGPLGKILRIEEHGISPKDEKDILGLPREALSFGHYDLLLICQPTPTVLYYLPWALAHMQEMLEEYGEVACRTVRAIRYEREELVGRGLYEGVLQELQAAFWIWLDRCEVQRDWESGAFPQSHTYLVGGEERNDFLRELQESQLMVGHQLLIDNVLSRLVKPAKVQWSLHVVDMLFVEEHSTMNSGLHTNTVFRQLMEDPERVRKHWQFVSDYVLSLAPGAYFQSRDAFVRRLGR